MKKMIALALMSTTLMGCQSILVDHQPPELAQKDISDSDWFFGNDLTAGTEVAIEQWWAVINDPTLNTLVETALENNASLAVSAATIKQAESSLSAIEAGFMPSISASATASREKSLQYGIANYSQVGISFDYALDLFGNNASLENAAEYQYQQQQELYVYAKSLIASNVVASYIQYQSLGEQYRLLSENAAALEETLALNKLLFDVGEIAQTDVDRVSADYYLIQAQASEMARLQELTKLQMAGLLTVDVAQIDALLIKNASDNQVEFASLPILQSKIQLIANRPDIKAQEYQVLAANQLTKNKLQNIYPDISISGFFGLADAGFSLSETIWSIAANAAMNLVDFGRLEAAENVEKAKESVAIAQYKQVVTDAILEVEQVLNDISAYQQQAEQYQQAAQSSQRAYDNVQLLYQEGEVSLLNVLDAQRVKNQSELQSTQAQANAQIAIAALYKALVSEAE